MNELDEMLERFKQKEIDAGIQIANLQAELNSIRAEYRDCVNELCLKCGGYHREHEGACDGCRWLKPRRGW